VEVLYPSDGPRRAVDPAALYADPARRRPGRARPWVLANMIASVDGAVAVDGRSGPLGGPTDRAVFSVLRGLADVVLVGAGTVRAERYRPPRRPELRVAVVSRRLDLDWSSDLFRSGRAFVVTTTEAGPVPDHVEALRAGRDEVDLAAALGELGRRGGEVVLCEGGPSLNGALVVAGLLDELCLTVAPLLVGGTSGRVAVGPAAPLQGLAVAHVATADDGYLFLRYLRSA